MKITRRQLRQIILEELNNGDEYTQQFAGGGTVPAHIVFKIFLEESGIEYEDIYDIDGNEKDGALLRISVSDMLAAERLVSALEAKWGSRYRYTMDENEIFGINFNDTWRVSVFPGDM